MEYAEYDPEQDNREGDGDLGEQVMATDVPQVKLDRQK